MITIVTAKGENWSRRVSSDDQELIKEFLKELAERAAEEEEVVVCEFS